MYTPILAQTTDQNNRIDDIIDFLTEQNAVMLRHLMLSVNDRERKEIIDAVIERLDKAGVLKNVEQYSSRIYGVSNDEN